MGWLVFFLVGQVPITADCVMLAGRSVAMDLPLDLERTTDAAFLDSLLEVFGYPARSGRLLLAGELPLRYYTGNFALRKPS